MISQTVHRHLLIDFENVPQTTLDGVAGPDLEISLLLGTKNTRLGVELVQQLLGGTCVHLIRVGASGRNALDLTLAYYLGRAAAETPGTEFFIISRDTDYDPMIDHIRRTGVAVSRHASVQELPFVTRAAPAQRPAPAHRPPPMLEERLQHFIDHLGQHPRNRPARRSTLIRHLKTSYGEPMSDDQVLLKIKALEAAGHLSITANGKVTYTS